MAKNNEYNEKVELANEYSFGKEVTVSGLTLDDEFKIEKEMIKHNGAGEKLFTVATCCGLNIDEAKELRRVDYNLIVETIEGL